MRILTLAFAAAFALSFLTLQAEPAQAVGLCTYNDTTNNMGGPGSECEGVFCMGYNSQTGWQTCVPDEACDVLECYPPCYYYGCPPPIEQQSSAVGPPTLCVGAIYNNQASQPSSGCDGIACTGFSQGDWKTCVLDCTADGCPQPTTASSSTVTACVAGVYNNAQGPSSGCDGYVCTGYANGDWDTCVLDCTMDGCPRIEDPCRYLMCQPPFDP